MGNLMKSVWMDLHGLIQSPRPSPSSLRPKSPTARVQGFSATSARQSSRSATPTSTVLTSSGHQIEVEVRNRECRRPYKEGGERYHVLGLTDPQHEEKSGEKGTAGERNEEHR